MWNAWLAMWWGCREPPTHADADTLPHACRNRLAGAVSRGMRQVVHAAIMAHSYDKIDRLALMAVRIGKEKSKALPRKYYSDPAYAVEYEQERLRREEREKRKKK